MSISESTPNEETTPHEFAANEHVTHEFAAEQYSTIEKEEQPFVASGNNRAWDKSSLIISTIFFIAILVIGVVAQRTLNHLAPNTVRPTTGMVIEESANAPTATPAYPTVYVQQSSDPSQAPSPLPPAAK